MAADELARRRTENELANDENLLDLIRETVSQLNSLADKLEAHAKQKSVTLDPKGREK